MAILIIYNLTKIPRKTATALYKDLYSHTTNSHKGKYKYKKTGLLSSMPHLKLLESSIAVKSSKDARKITDLLKKYKIPCKTYSISISSSEFK